MYRFNANSRATISSTAIFFSQQSRQYFSSPRGSDTSLAPHRAQRALTTVFRDIGTVQSTTDGTSDARWPSPPGAQGSPDGRDDALLYRRPRFHGGVAARRRQRVSLVGNRQPCAARGGFVERRR